jgi:excisionase family DNA binding protein
MASDDPLLTVRGLAELEGVSQDTIRNFIKNSAMPHYRLQGIKIRLSEYQAWLKDMSSGTSVEAAGAASALERVTPVLQSVAPLLRAAGVLSVAIEGARFELAPAAPAAAAAQAAPVYEPEPDAIDDPLAYGGTMPGFARLHQDPE